MASRSEGFSAGHGWGLFRAFLEGMPPKMARPMDNVQCGSTDDVVDACGSMPVRQRSDLTGSWSSRAAGTAGRLFPFRIKNCSGMLPTSAGAMSACTGRAFPPVSTACLEYLLPAMLFAPACAILCATYACCPTIPSRRNLRWRRARGAVAGRIL